MGVTIQEKTRATQNFNMAAISKMTAMKYPELGFLS